MELETFTQHYSFGDITYYKTGDERVFEDRQVAENHQKFIDEVPQHLMTCLSKLSNIHTFYRIDGQPQLDMFIVEMEDLHENEGPVHYEVILDGTEELKFPLFLSLSYIYDDEYSYYVVESLVNSFAEWQEKLRNEQRALLEATEALCALQE